MFLAQFTSINKKTQFEYYIQEYKNILTDWQSRQVPVIWAYLARFPHFRSSQVRGTQLTNFLLIITTLIWQ